MILFMLKILAIMKHKIKCKFELLLLRMRKWDTFMLSQTNDTLEEKSQ